MSPKTTMKGPLEDADDAPAVKRGRGRPRKNPNAPPSPPKDPNAPKRGRGRPRKDPNVPAPPPRAPDAPKLGRPRKNPTESPPVKSLKVAGRGRGRPRKEAVEPSPAVDPAAPVRGRGRPKKEAAASSSPTKRLLPRAPSAKKPSPKGIAKPGIQLSGIIGTYELFCDEVESYWPDKAEEISLSISALPHSKSSLIASFNLGVNEGTMLLATNKETLGPAQKELEGGSSSNSSENTDISSDPNLNSRIVYFTWRGRDVDDEDKAWPSARATQTGILKFADDKCSSFKGVGTFAVLGAQ
ncbi:hypothetical protein CC80DRAFT_538911 [Byssothecium circinans]|uniref:Uncharacterized protein n=1 Tax=Byssothecium circinans TaxID=147558 RepID=A0A6A5TFS3_9PLEO|nr:hypothetical protein CC80DRAFT_538911 [Byssothecium circinans]